MNVTIHPNQLRTGTDLRSATLPASTKFLRRGGDGAPSASPDSTMRSGATPSRLARRPALGATRDRVLPERGGPSGRLPAPPARRPLALLVEDRPEQARLFREAWKQAGLRTRLKIVTSEQEAADTILRARSAVSRRLLTAVFVDLHVEGLDVERLLAAIRAPATSERTSVTLMGDPARLLVDASRLADRADALLVTPRSLAGCVRAIRLLLRDRLPSRISREPCTSASPRLRWMS